jgi:DNA-binding SARP family transcriptional activator
LDATGCRLALAAEGALGHRQAVIDRYQRLTQHLDEQLGLRPGADVRAAYRRLLGPGPDPAGSIAPGSQAQGGPGIPPTIT